MSDQYRPVRVCAGGVWQLAAMLLVCAGCQTPMNVGSLSPFGRSEEELTDTVGIAGPLERALRAARGESASDDPNYDPTVGLDDYRQAEALYQAGNYEEALKAFKRITKQYKNYPVREDALFMLGESQFALKKYSWAQDSYGKLLEDFPSTRHLDQVTRRYFTIARTWLDFPEVVQTAEVEPVNFDNPKSTPRPVAKEQKPLPLTRRIPILPNFVDRTRPVFDTDGRALESLKAIWLNDPTGPLADDALMLTASHHFRNGDFLEADRVYTILREEYPKSPHLQNAFVLGSHVKLMSYQGPAYDGRSLEEAQKLKESTLRVFQDLPAADRERQLHEIRQIEESHAAQDWEMVKLYEKKGEPKAVQVYCKEVIRRYPHTSYADLARQKLAQNTPGRVKLSDEPQPDATEPPPADVPQQSTQPAPLQPPAEAQPVPVEPAAPQQTNPAIEPPWSPSPAPKPEWSPTPSNDPPGRVKL